MQLALEKIIVNPGQQLLLKELDWQTFEEILSELGESRASRLSYSNGFLEIMVPLPEHEKDKEIIGDIIKILLDAQNINFEPLGSTTFKNELMNQAVEPDACFYIKNYQAVIGKNKLNLEIDPPPDLVIEIDITSRTHLDNYRLLGVPELWRYTQSGLQINLLQEGEYIESLTSPNFPNIPIVELINQYVRQSQQLGRSEAIRNFKNWLRENIDNDLT
ncbi:Uma2 family endonuclease [Crocosphaera sp. XPORK-15E]|uniref:Uma2 family endonuclease n=1 Tax=Crocosphaera sp. XPORK-15E TaxID=3110247 RepID=UPI002B1FE8C3|nr:Uma2 family endonuclease [Crocosphaera sp. XPORK-15E]MEA5535805.1 Uma2 family endonuclease [Crocosphaera sp. XPORK-15E]